MYAIVTLGIEVNDEPTPGYNEYIYNEYGLHEHAKTTTEIKTCNHRNELCKDKKPG